MKTFRKELAPYIENANKIDEKYLDRVILSLDLIQNFMDDWYKDVIKSGKRIYKGHYLDESNRTLKILKTVQKKQLKKLRKQKWLEGIEQSKGNKLIKKVLPIEICGYDNCYNPSYKKRGFLPVCKFHSKNPRLEEEKRVFVGSLSFKE